MEAEAIYDGGRDACVEFLVELDSRFEREVGQLRERVARLEEQERRDSRNSSSPPSQDPPKTRAERRAEARVKAKRGPSERVSASRAPSLGTRGRVASCFQRIRSMR